MTRSASRPTAAGDSSDAPVPSDSRAPSDFERPSSSLIGRLTLRSMNLWHTPLHRWGLAAAGIGADSRVLDVGCGGAAAPCAGSCA